MTKKQIKRVAIYTRVSTADQAQEGFSLGAQENVLKQYCAAYGYEISDIYTDAGISAKDMRRPAMQQMMLDATCDKFDYILVWKLTRFSRNLKDMLMACEQLESLGIYLISYSESFDSSTSQGRMLRGILGVIAQWEREIISENVTMGLNERARKGLRTCSGVLGYDIEKGTEGMRINREESEIVTFIFSEYLKCKSLTEVAYICFQRGYVGKRGRHFSPQSIRKILTNSVYAGYYSWHQQPIRGDFVPIMSVADYNRTQRLLKSMGKLTGRNLKLEYIALSE